MAKPQIDIGNGWSFDPLTRVALHASGEFVIAALYPKQSKRWHHIFAVSDHSENLSQDEAAKIGMLVQPLIRSHYGKAQPTARGNELSPADLADLPEQVRTIIERNIRVWDRNWPAQHIRKRGRPKGSKNKTELAA